jgi:hypothetical protein
LQGKSGREAEEGAGWSAAAWVAAAPESPLSGWRPFHPKKLQSRPDASTQGVSGMTLAGGVYPRAARSAGVPK